MRLNLILLISIFLILSCSEKEKKIQVWGKYSVDGNLKNLKVFKEMMNENEIQMLIDSKPPKAKKTTKLVFDDSDQYICYPFFWNTTDTLNVNIVYHSGYTSGGFNIRVNNGSYEVYPFMEDDVLDNEKASFYKDSKQKLILDKKSYKRNDSIYGYTEFEKTEHDSYGNVIKHKGKGYFRGKIDFEGTNKKSQ